MPERKLNTFPRERKRSHSPLLRYVAPLAIAAAIFLYFVYYKAIWKMAQVQTDPKIARVWLLGVTMGSEHALKRGTNLQKWLNSNNIHLFGDYTVLTSSNRDSDNGLVAWFTYDSFLPGHPDLVCHRVNKTAFIDNLGQEYHGLLEFRGKYVGVYLPGYDHAASQIKCIVHWMDRRETLAQYKSTPMTFTINLPPAKRKLPLVSAIPQTALTSAKQGVSVTVSDARLSGPIFATTPTAQRNISFRIRVKDGLVASENVDPEPTLSSYSTASILNELMISSLRRNPTVKTSSMNGTIIGFGKTGRRTFRARPISYPGGTIYRQTKADDQLSFESSDEPFTITDPYGISLFSQHESLSPLLTRDTIEDRKAGLGTRWTAPINGAGRGTDVVHLHFQVLPVDKKGKPISEGNFIPFDFDLPVASAK